MGIEEITGAAKRRGAVEDRSRGGSKPPAPDVWKDLQTDKGRVAKRLGNYRSVSSQPRAGVSPIKDEILETTSGSESH